MQPDNMNNNDEDRIMPRQPGTSGSTDATGDCTQRIIGAIIQAAEGFAGVPHDFDFDTEKVRDTILNKEDWNDFSSRLVSILEAQGCVIGDDTICIFWQENRRWSDLIASVCELCL